ncbi:MAG TPA: NAD(P)H-hydrate dehydratase [Gemmatimonadaceae bacterium]
MPLPKIGGASDKEDRGCAMVIGGSEATPGAALLAGVAALRAGAGKLQIATPNDVAIQLGLAVPEAMVIGLPSRAAMRKLAPHLSQADAILIGPGMDEKAATASLVRDVAKRMQVDATLVLDAVAIRWADHLRRGVITPHSGEMADLMDVPREEVEANALEFAVLASERFGCVVALKGATSFIAAGAEVYRFDGGSVGLATSGSGDTLAGVVVGLAARGADPLTAALWAVWAHGTAGVRLAKRVNRVGFLARELLAELPAVLSS